MRHLRYNIISSAGIIAALGVLIAAFRDPTRLWGSILFSVSISSLAIAVGGALYRQGHRRAFWVGFLICGWLYLILSLLPPLAPITRPHLITTAFLAFLEGHIPKPNPSAMKGLAQPVGWEVWSLPETQGGLMETVLPNFAASIYGPRLIWVGHSSWSLLMALLGGHIFKYFYLSARTIRHSDHTNSAVL